MPGVPARLDGLDARPSTASQFPGYAPKYITWTYTPSLTSQANYHPTCCGGFTGLRQPSCSSAARRGKPRLYSSAACW